MSIHLAAARGDVEELREELAIGDVGAPGTQRDFGKTALIRAAESEVAGPELLQLLLAAGAAVNATDVFGRSALHIVRGPRAAEKALVLLDAGADPNSRDASRCAPIHYVGDGPSASGVARALLDRGALLPPGILRWCLFPGSHPAVLRLLVEHGAEVRELGLPPLFEAIVFGGASEVAESLLAGPDLAATDDRGRTPFLLASTFGDLRTCELLLAAGAELDASDRFGITALMNAATRGEIELVEWLLSVSADADSPNGGGESVLELASLRGELEVVRALLRAGVGVNAAEEYGRGVVSCAALRRRNGEVIRELAASGANLDFIDNEGYTALGSAAELACLENLRTLLDLGASTQSVGTSALHRAVYVSCPRTVRLLLDNGADPNAQDYDGCSPVHAALRKESAVILDLLIEGGADLELADDFGDTALLNAAYSSNPAALRRLLAAGADVRATNRRNGSTALHWAVEKRNFAAVQLLVEAGADPEARDGIGESVLEAAEQSAPEILAYLRSRLG